jgi:hypothetical protein
MLTYTADTSSLLLTEVHYLGIHGELPHVISVACRRGVTASLLGSSRDRDIRIEIALVKPFIASDRGFVSRMEQGHCLFVPSDKKTARRFHVTSH